MREFIGHPSGLRKRNPKLPVGQWQTIPAGRGQNTRLPRQIYKRNGDMMAKNHPAMLVATKKLHFPLAWM